MLETRTPDLGDTNATSRQRLIRVITWSEGFALGFAQVNSLVHRRVLAEEIREAVRDEVRVVEVEVSPEETDLEGRLRQRYEAERDTADRLAFFVYGVERVLSEARKDERQSFLAVLNYKRENLQRTVPCPIVIWVPEFALRILAERAPDLWAWRSGVFDFTTPPDEVDRQWAAIKHGGSVDEYTGLSPAQRRERIQSLEALYHDYSERDDADEPEVLRIRYDLADRLGRLYRYVPAIARATWYSRTALAIAERIGDPLLFVRASSNLGVVLREQGDLDGAEDTFRRALTINEGINGPDHPSVAISVSNLGGVLHERGDFDGAEAAFRRSLSIDESIYGPEHPDVAVSLNNLGTVLQARGDFDGAEGAFRRALAIGETVYGPDHPKIATRASNLGIVLRARGDLDGAEAAYRRAITIDEAVYGSRHPEVATDMNNLGSVLWDRGDLDGAEALCRRALAIDESVYGPDHPKIAIRLTNLGLVLRARGDLNDAEGTHHQALTIMEAYSPNHPNTQTIRNNLAAVRAQLAEAETSRQSGEG